MEEFVVENTGAQPILSIRKVTSVDSLPEEMGKAFQSVIAAIVQAGGKPAGAPFAAYYNMDMQNLDVEMGFPVARPMEGRGGIIAREIPAGKKAAGIHRGPYREMAGLYDAMQKWMTENGHQPTGIVYEFYLNSPMEVSEDELLTRVVFPLK